MKRKRVEFSSPTAITITSSPPDATLSQLSASLRAKLGINASMHRPTTNTSQGSDTPKDTLSEITNLNDSFTYVGNTLIKSLQQSLRQIRKEGRHDQAVTYYANLLISALSNGTPYQRHTPQQQQQAQTSNKIKGWSCPQEGTPAQGPTKGQGTQRPTGGKENVRIRS
ncbi:uncharacterized protein GLRG_00806 [Colletotrichum graminicola M1.001]|uniref:Uncharacterized protein n=1 Tax=Colletotrichum graminicola (strain M1.001 / M2 / FGSC 10212) TaxID=645133 RepID=E3Q3R0_COLGM|nr:uncharacterized protein GLRG_00806 [Colletotrichum graminicola M1.001]EFQ25662.1 hypothetical protein GLRG_00806 [Colletotrichum graminicola M1.001]